VPFFVTALLVNSLLEHMNKVQKVLSVFNKVGGIFLVVIGLLMATNYLAVISEKIFSSFAR
jgi:cytochrome c-type biogenesis protein